MTSVLGLEGPERPACDGVSGAGPLSAQVKEAEEFEFKGQTSEEQKWAHKPGKKPDDSVTRRLMSAPPVMHNQRDSEPKRKMSQEVGVSPSLLHLQLTCSDHISGGVGGQGAGYLSVLIPLWLTHSAYSSLGLVPS